MKEAQFVVGIDLGTTHCAMAAALLLHPRLHLLSIPQLVAPGEVSTAELLPSFLYLPTPGELGPDERALPWGSAENIVGKYARVRGAQSPSRLVASAKSWVCHGGVNRRAAILPWGAPDSEPHVSPYDAQVAYLAHLERAWSAKYPDAQLSEQDVVVTVPASFDEGARSLTREAAAEAGLGRVRLLEEPQAAFYDYLGTHSADEQGAFPDASFQQNLASAKLILVVDVGGGTTDLTLLRVLSQEANETSLPSIERIAVGGHLMLGGDNMDAALALYALKKAKIPRPEDASIWSALVQSARDVKQQLLSAEAPKAAVLSYQGRGSRLVGSTKSITITRDEALKLLLDGFFPYSGGREGAERSARAGLTTLGLPYASDTAVPRHICAFLRKHAAAALEAGASVSDGLAQPDLILFNGGVFKSPAIAERLLEVLAGWYGGQAPTLLEHTSLETSVARGAARSALARHGLGAAIGGGTAKAYYIGIEHENRTFALCVAPRNVEEGTRITIDDRLFELRLNEPVAFPLFAYTGSRADAAGTLLDHSSEAHDLLPLAPLETILRGQKTAKERETTLAVSIESFVDDTGSLKLSLISAELPPRRFQLEFVVRSAASKSAPLPSEAFTSQLTSAGAVAVAPAVQQETSEPPHALAREAARLIEAAFSSSDGQRASGLRLELEKKLGPRGEWSGATCRLLADACLRVETERAQSELHELNWLRLVSWTMRPGVGCAGDHERLLSLWALHAKGLAVANKTNWGEWWILWRRVAAGLDERQQALLFEQVRPSLWPEAKAGAGAQEQVQVQMQGSIEMMRMVAALERLPASAKQQAGDLFIERVKKLGSYWPLGRVGARVLFYGSLASVVDRGVVDQKCAEGWLVHLLALDWNKSEGAAFAAASIARKSGDATRDLSQELRQTVAQRLSEVGANSSWLDMVLQSSELAQGDIKRVLGDSLPAGLRLN